MQDLKFLQYADEFREKLNSDEKVLIHEFIMYVHERQCEDLAKKLDKSRSE